MGHQEPSLSEAVGDLLPYLRRYARALTGQQKTGDALVVSLLEKLLAHPPFEGKQSNLRARLFGNLGEIHDQQLSQLETVPDNIRIANLPEHRALLLTTMEGFSDVEAAEALGISVSDVTHSAASGLSDLMQTLATSAMVIEDEPFIAYDLKHILGSLGHNVLATATTRTEAVDAASRFLPSLILADVRLADESSGIDAVADILKFCPATVVFVTAYPEGLLTGEGREPAFLIPKPFKPETVRTVVCQALLMKQLPEAATP